MPSNDSIERVTTDVPGLPAIYGHNGLLKVVYSNRPDLVRSRYWQFFRHGELPFFFPENLITGENLEEELRKLQQGSHIIFTNSLYLLRAFQMIRRKMGKAISFIYIQFSPEPHNMHVCPYQITQSNNLEVMDVPQLGWENTQSEAYLAEQPA
ncbi:MAG TPA: hypothetical protein PKD38_19920 [Nitrospira sp.]|nr:hypothetical protein [Nitrospira sp.]